jgi:eukaryotic-like serine/threonine-protein kinase
MQTREQEAHAKVFAGRYEIRGLIGSGGMSKVYRGFDKLLERDVAVKVLSPELSSEDRFVARFRREAQIAARFSHPNVVSLYDYGVDSGDYFIVMELIDGKTVADLIERHGALEPRRAVEIAADVARALAEAHQSGLVHRDITANNLMIGPTGTTKVADFGIADIGTSEAHRERARSDAVLGTAAYLSPEQVRGLPVDPRSDIYSLGVVLFEMLTGTVPFRGDTPFATASKHVSDPAPPPSDRSPTVPPDLDAIVLRALAKDPGSRFPDAIDMEADLARFLAGRAPTTTQPIQARSEGLATRTLELRPRTTRLQRLFGSARRGLAMLFVAVVAAVGGFLWAGATGADGIPNLEGRLVSDARARLAESGLSLRVEENYGEAPAGVVVGQSPPPGTEMEEGETVILVVSKGPPPPPPGTLERLRDGVDQFLRGLGALISR